MFILESILFSGKTIFFSALDWGLGHVTRSVPILKALEKQNKIILGVTQLTRDLYTMNFPGLQQIELPSYRISYSASLPVWLKILLQWPEINSVIRQENKLLADIVKRYAIDVVISDSRFGLHASGCKNIFITHQLKLAAPFFSFFANRQNKKFIHNFDEVWVPDYEEEESRLSGKLSSSDKIRIPVKYLGPQSALLEIKDANSKTRVDILILLSGVEPQRQILEKLLVGKFRDSGKKIVLVRGSAAKAGLEYGTITVSDMPQPAELRQLIMSADKVICRSGYSTLMDLHLLNKKNLVLVPTPGQTEQEYLAGHWAKKFKAITVKQQEIPGFKM